MSTINNQNIKQCSLLNMSAIPTFGIYDRNDYLLMEPFHIIKSQRMMPDNLPPSLFQNIKILFQKYKKIIPEFYHITLDANRLYSSSNERIIETNMIRINLVAHPYIFCNSNITQTSITHINCAIFKENDELETILESNEEDGIKINPEYEITSSKLNREIKIEIVQNNKNLYLEPNNCSFLINLNSQLINFYCIVLGTHNNIVTKCFIGNYVIMPNAFNSHLLKNISQNLLNYQNNNELFLNLLIGQLSYNDSVMGILFYFLDIIIKNNSNKRNIEGIKIFFIKGFKLIYEFDTNNINHKDHEQDLYNIGNFYFEQIKKFINYIYEGSSYIENFSEKVLLCSLKDNYIIEIIIKYIDFHLSRINNIICSYFDYFNKRVNFTSLKEEASKIHKEKNWKMIHEIYCKQLNINKKDFDKAISYFINKNRKKIVNHNIELFDRLCKGLLDNQNIDEKILEEIDEPIKEYFYYHIWVYKGQLKGIHKNFGEYSFLCSNKIKSIYHCQTDERYNFSDRMKSILIEADKSYSEQK